MQRVYNERAQDSKEIKKGATVPDTTTSRTSPASAPNVIPTIEQSPTAITNTGIISVIMYLSKTGILILLIFSAICLTKFVVTHVQLLPILGRNSCKTASTFGFLGNSIGNLSVGFTEQQHVGLTDEPQKLC